MTAQEQTKAQACCAQLLASWDTLTDEQRQAEASRPGYPERATVSTPSPLSGRKTRVLG